MLRVAFVRRDLRVHCSPPPYPEGREVLAACLLCLARIYGACEKDCCCSCFLSTWSQVVTRCSTATTNTWVQHRSMRVLTGWLIVRRAPQGCKRGLSGGGQGTPRVASCFLLGVGFPREATQPCSTSLRLEVSQNPRPGSQFCLMLPLNSSTTSRSRFKPPGWVELRLAKV